MNRNSLISELTYSAKGEFSEKDLPLSSRKEWVKPSGEHSIIRQCRLAGISGSAHYYEQARASKENLNLMRLIDEQYLKHPEFGYPRMTDWLQGEG